MRECSARRAIRSRWGATIPPARPARHARGRFGAVDAPLSGRHFLLVDENAELAAILADALARLGARVTQCASGREAMARNNFV